MRKLLIGAVVVALGMPGLLAAPVASAAGDPKYSDEACRTSAMPWADDPCAGRQWGLVNIQAPEAWKHAKGEGVTVALVDTGADRDHPDLAGKLVMIPGADVIKNNAYPCSLPEVPRGTDSSDALAVDDHTHGTLVAGILGAAANKTGVVGVAPRARIMPVKAIGDNPAQSSSALYLNWARGICFAVDHGADVINLSAGADPLQSLVVENTDSVATAEPVRAALAYAASKGVPVISGAGNYAAPLCNWPAHDPLVLCVGGVDRADLKGAYSNFGDGLDLVAPGGRGDGVLLCRHDEHVWTTMWPDVKLRTPPLAGTPLEPADQSIQEVLCPYPRGYAARSGTSLAAPHVAGVAALIVDTFHPTKDAAGRSFVLNRLLQTSDDLGAPGYDPVFGHGRVNALRAVS